MDVVNYIHPLDLIKLNEEFAENTKKKHLSDIEKNHKENALEKVSRYPNKIPKGKKLPLNTLEDFIIPKKNRLPSARELSPIDKIKELEDWGLLDRL